MPCFHPVQGYRNTDGSLTFKRGPTSTGQLMSVACGQCNGCRLRRSKEWAVRCVHEDRMTFEKTGRTGSFVTLTYDRENLPWDGSVSRSEHQTFIRALRDKLRPKGISIRYYMCGEYGEDEYQDYQREDGSFGRYRVGPGRPHYHYLIFGYNFGDRYEWTQHRGHQYYRSPLLESVWTKGHSIVGNVTPETAAYTARYVMKKQLGKTADDHYTRIITGRDEPVSIEREFALMSLKPGIGASWFQKYGRSDIYDSGDFVVIEGKKYATPRYYDKLFEDLDERELISIRRDRRRRMHEQREHSTPERMAIREELTEIRLNKLKRGLQG